MRARLVLAALAAVSLNTAALAADPFGTAGAFRRLGWAQCDKPFEEWKDGACDPAPVDATLDPVARSGAHIERAKLLVAQTRMEEALRAANAAVADDPRSIAALTFRGRLELSLQHPDVAERDFNAALLLDPRNPVLLASRAETLLRNGATRAALDDVTAALAQTPDSFDALWIKARIYIALGQRERAEEDLERALRIEPDERQVRLFRSQQRLHMGKFQGAVDDATLILDRHRGDSSAREVRAVANTALGRRAEAVADLGEILGPPGEPTPAVGMRHYHGLLMQRAMLLVQLDRRDEATRDIDTLVRAGGKQAMLRMQVHLRRSGFPDIALDGQRSTAFDEALKACLLNQACARGLTQPT
jgi:tetratricopeptide (TPR) repeat protein